MVADAPEGSIEYYLYKPEGVIRFAINNIISKLNSSILSSPTYIRGLPWYVIILYHPSVDCINVCVCHVFEVGMIHCFDGLVV